MQVGIARWEAGVFWALTTVVLLSPLPFGADRPLPASLLFVVIGALVLAWGAAASVAAIGPAVLARPLLPAGVLFAATAAWAAAQAASFSPGWSHHPYWAQARTVLEVPVDGAISVDPAATWTRLQGLLAYGGVFWLAFQLCTTRTRARQVMLALTLAGLAYATYGLYAYFDRPGPVTSTFVNRNSYATYAGMTLLCGLGLVMQRFARSVRSDVPVGRALLHLLSRLDLATTVGMLGFVASSMALLLTQSRGAFIAVAVACLLYIRLLRTALIIESRTFYIGFVALAMIGAVSLISFSGEATMQRFGEAGVNFGNRLVYYQATWDAIQDRPLLGTGYGTYAEAFMAYNRPKTGTYFLDKAHNTYLQLIMELGWPAALALFLSIGGLAFRCWQRLSAGAHNKVYPAAVLACSALVAVHSLVDFSLEMPANAMTYALLLGMGCAQTLLPRRERTAARAASEGVATSPG